MNRHATPLHTGRLDTPIGPVYVARTAAGVCRISFRARSAAAFHLDLRRRFGTRTVAAADDAVAAVLREIDDWFGGRTDRLRFAIDLIDCTPFGRRVLTATTRIGFGRLASYGTIAARIGRPGAARAVGNALGRNPVPIRIPCHRVIAGDGSLGGFTGGTRFKRQLLQHEGHSDTTRPGVNPGA